MKCPHCQRGVSVAIVRDEFSCPCCNSRISCKNLAAAFGASLFILFCVMFPLSLSWMQLEHHFLAFIVDIVGVIIMTAIVFKFLVKLHIKN